MKKHETGLKLIMVLMIVVFTVGCFGPSRKVVRLETEKVTDLSGRWNDTDSRLTAEAMIQDLIVKSWMDTFLKENHRKPVIIVGTVRNKSSEHINTNLFIKDLERALINSGKVTFVASADQRQELRKEIKEQQFFASPESAKKLADETGADYMLTGVIYTIVDSFEGRKVVYYQVDLELINLESHTKAWIGDKKIKKYIKQNKYKW